jgi:hypothetical protein
MDILDCLKTKIELDYPNKQGSTARDVLLSVQRQSAIAGKEYIDPKLKLPTEPKAAGKFIWDLFWDINKGRSSTGYGPAPINYTEILSYIQLYSLKIEPWELDALRRMDTTYLSEVQLILSEDT